MSILAALIGPVTSIIDKLVTDKDKAAQLAHDIATMAEGFANEQAKAQMEVNKQEAAHKNIFVAGWRPGAAWVCVAGMAFNFIAVPIAGMAGVAGATPLDMATMMPVLLGMLGLGSARSLEKIKGVARER